jgi:class 3 adenylate cyclase
MSAEIKKQIQLEIAHVLFIDIVGYSKLSINEQRAAVEELSRIVRATEQFQRGDARSRLLKIPADGMALVFYTSPESAVQCAVKISRALKEHPRLQLRMGIHSGPVSGVVDVNERPNLAGAGLNIAQRVIRLRRCRPHSPFQARRRGSERAAAVPAAFVRPWHVRAEARRLVPNSPLVSETS